MPRTGENPRQGKQYMHAYFISYHVVSHKSVNASKQKRIQANSSTHSHIPSYGGQLGKHVFKNDSFCLRSSYLSADQLQMDIHAILRASNEAVIVVVATP